MILGFLFLFHIPGQTNFSFACDCVFVFETSDQLFYMPQLRLGLLMHLFHIPGQTNFSFACDCVFVFETSDQLFYMPQLRLGLLMHQSFEGHPPPPCPLAGD